MKSLNNTLGVIATGTISILSECWNLDSSVDGTFFHWTHFWDSDDEEVFNVGYQVRAEETTLVLPKIIPQLVSESNYFTFCGPIKYRIEYDDDSPLPDVICDTCFNYAPDNLEPPSIRVWTDDSNIAGLEDPYETMYSIHLYAHLSYYGLTVYSYTEQVIEI